MPEIEKNNVDAYIEFVQKEIEKYDRYSLLIRHGSISPLEICRALGEYTRTSLALDSEYDRASMAHVTLMDEFNEWWDEVYLAAREVINPTSLPGNKWAGKGEIESFARFKNKEIYREWRNKLKISEARLSFLGRLKENWKRHREILLNLNQSMRSELRALGTEDDANREDLPKR